MSDKSIRGLPAIKRYRSLEDLEDDRWGSPPTDATTLVRTVHRLRRMPVEALSVENLRLLIGQRIGLPVLVPLAIEILREAPLAEGDMFEGDLLLSVVRCDEPFWAKHPALAEHVRGILDSLSERPEELCDAIERFMSFHDGLAR